MASSHKINHTRRIVRRERCTVQEVRIMRAMRFHGYNLAEIAKMTDRTVPCVWSKTADVTHKNWLKDRYLQRMRAGSMAHLLDVA